MSQTGATESTAVRQPAPPFRIVGVGASAGGLAATTKLLRYLGAEPGLAVVIIHHLDPTHESSLVEIFGRTTPLPVTAAVDGMVVEPNHVYVVPPNAGLLLVDGALKLTPRLSTAGLHLPIDQFFESLAVGRGADAIGVLLTGSGSDGAEGIRAIKNEGGVTFAQDASAEYGAMPEAATATGCVDFVLGLEEIARELLRLGARPTARPDEGDDEPDFQRIVRSLRKASGIDFANYKQTTIRRRVQRRLVVHGLRSLREYADLLEKSADEAAALTEESLIHVTGFFRDPETFEVLSGVVFPKLLENRPRDAALRIWVPGCATGEEVYSIAITLLEYLTDANAIDIPIKVFGTDVSLRVIDKARAARYPTNIEHDVSPGRLRRFFTRTEGGYQIRKDVRDLCVFAKQDATRDPPFSGLDLISCRNLMIYLGTALQERILPVFHYALKEPGFLVLGSSETVRSFPGFSTLDAKNKIFARTSASPRLLFDFTERRFGDQVPAEAQTSSEPSRLMGPLDVHREADRLVLAEFAPPGVVITDDLAIVQFRGKTGPFLEPSPGVASFDLLRMVREELRIPLRQTIDEARAKLQIARRTGLPMTSGDALRLVDLEVIPFRPASTPQRFFVVLFKSVAPKEGEEESKAVPPEAPRSSVELQLAQELASTRDYLQAIIEQLEASNEELKAANEEIVSSNEELRSTNEELQMAKEELQATNEELRTVNDEMIVRNLEGTRLNDDLTNVLNSVEIPIIILGRDSRVRRFTPAAAKAFRLGASDIGRSFAEVAPRANAVELGVMISDVLEHLGSIERTAQDDAGRWYQFNVRPYLTVDNRIDGTVIAAFDVDLVKRGEQLLIEARTFAENIVDTVRECLVVLDQDLRVRSANRAFHKLFRTTAKELEGKTLFELGQGEWDLPALRRSLEELDETHTLEGLRVEQDFGPVGRRAFVLNARRIEHTSFSLLALADVTDKERAEAALVRTERGFREMLMTAADAVFMTDAAGRIVFANQSAMSLFGYSAEELVSMSIAALVPDAAREGLGQPRPDSMATPAPRPLARGRDLNGRRKDGTEFPIEVVLGSIASTDGPLGVSFISDISARRETEKKLSDYQDRLQQMAFDAAVAAERERRRIAVDLHDRIGQALSLAQIKLTSVREGLAGVSRAAVDQGIELIAQSINDTRTLIFELSPPVLYDLGLKEALSWLVEEVEKRHGLHIDLVEDNADKPLDEVTAALVFRAVRELLMNVFKHARSPLAKVSLRRAGDEVEVDVEDRGIGFTPDEPAPRTNGGGFGLLSVREQIRRLGGTVEVESAPGRGTRVSMRVPVRGSLVPSQHNGAK